MSDRGSQETFRQEECRSGLPCSAIRSELHRILTHREFKATGRIRDFLRFVVEETLAGRDEQLKGYTIATEVFGREADFDAARDPVVRIQAGVLRRALERYYLVAGANDTIHIDIPKGTYVPVFTVPRQHESDGACLSHVDPADSWPAVMVNPFQNLTGDPDLEFLGAGLATELCLELARYEGCRVFVNREGKPGHRAGEDAVRFAIDGSVLHDGSQAKVTMQLFDTMTGEQVWGDQFTFAPGDPGMFSFQEASARKAAVHVASDRGAIARALSGSVTSGMRGCPQAFQAVLKYFAYDRALTPESYREAFEALQAAVAAEPECAPALCMLSLMYGDNIALEFMDVALTPLDEALVMARRCVRLEPDSQLNQLAMGRMSMLNDDVEAAVVQTRTALELNPESLCYLDVLGHQLVMLGEVGKGLQIVRKAIRRNPFYRDYVRYAFWVDCFLRGDYEQAYREMELLSGVGDFWDPLARAATLGHLGRIEEGREAVATLLAHKPDFPSRGRVLINHSVKIASVSRGIVEGLREVGLDID